jgi:hypothetical protein
MVGAYNAAVRTVVIADIVAVGCLILATLLYLLNRQQG